MVLSTPYFFQWQNPELRATIYPFREKKLRDFLLIYEEIDLWSKVGTLPVDPQVASQIMQEFNSLQARLAQTRQEKLQADQAIVAARQKFHQLFSNPLVIKLLTQKINAENQAAQLKPGMDTVKRQVDWYSQNAPDHPYFDRYTQKYQAARAAYDAAVSSLNAIQSQYDAQVAPFEAETKALTARQADLAAQALSLTQQIRAYPPVAKTGVTQRMVVRRQMQKRAAELETLTHDQLLAKVLERFDKEPQRYPKWLQYMVIHFSGMRYKSSHASWANPVDLVEALKIDAVKTRYLKPTSQLLDQDCAQAIQELNQAKASTPPDKIGTITSQINALSNPVIRQTALVKYRTGQVALSASQVNEAVALQDLAAMQSQLPDWVWKEIVARTQLRLTVTGLDWENLTPQQQQERWRVDSDRWRAIMDAWERKDITEWRAEHARTLELIVSRAVCNEIAEHIQHLRGMVPPGGLTAKPNWYLGLQKKDPAQTYFRRPSSLGEMKSGASILFLGWVTQRPNAWQIANPLPGIDLLGGNQPPGTPVADPKVEKKVTPIQPTGLFLRWTHEATIVDVQEMADGYQVLTFETGQIGLNLRPLFRMLNHWDIFVGYTPGSPASPANLDAMLDRSKVVPPSLEAGGESFGFGEEVIEAELVEMPPGESLNRMQVLARIWNSLTRRQQQALALYCQGFTTREIATRLDTSTGNVRKQLDRLGKSFDVPNRALLPALLSGWDFSGVSIPEISQRTV